MPIIQVALQVRLLRSMGAEVEVRLGVGIAVTVPMTMPVLMPLVEATRGAGSRPGLGAAKTGLSKVVS